MLICVETDASRDCGSGETVTRLPASDAETFRCAGAQLGDTPGSTNPLDRATTSARLERGATSAAAAASSRASVAPASASGGRLAPALTP